VLTARGWRPVVRGPSHKSISPISPYVLSRSPFPPCLSREAELLRPLAAWCRPLHLVLGTGRDGVDLTWKWSISKPPQMLSRQTFPPGPNFFPLPSQPAPLARPEPMRAFQAQERIWQRALAGGDFSRCSMPPGPVSVLWHKFPAFPLRRLRGLLLPLQLVLLVQINCVAGEALRHAGPMRFARGNQTVTGSTGPFRALLAGCGFISSLTRLPILPGWLALRMDVAGAGGIGWPVPPCSWPGV